MLEQIDSPSRSEYARLKGRFQHHQILLQSNQDLSDEQIQLAVDALLTDQDLDAQMADVLGKEPSQRWFRALPSRWKLGVGYGQSQTSSSKRSHLSFMADSDFLAELHATLTDQPVYKEVAVRIITSAGQQLCMRLKRFLRDSLANAEDGLAKVLRQEVQRNFANSREQAGSRANAELRNQVRDALVNEHEVPGNQSINLSFCPLLIHTADDNRRCVYIRGVTREERDRESGGHV